MQTYQPSVYQYSPSVNYQQPPVSSRKGLFIKILIVFVLVFGAGGGGVLYYLENVPEKQLEKMILALENVKTVEYEGEMKISFDSSQNLQTFGSDNADSSFLAQIIQAPLTEAASSGGNLYAKFRGKSDNMDDKNPAFSLALGLQMTGDDFDQFGSDSIMVNGQGILKDKNLYLKVSNIPAEFTFDMSVLLDKWIRFPLNESASSMYPMYGVSPLSQASESAELYKKYQSQIEQAYIKNKFLVSSVKERNVELNARKTTQYSFSLDKSKFAGFMSDFYAVYEEKKLSEEELKEFTENLDVVKDFSFDLWLGNSDHLPYKVSFKTDIEAKDPTPGKGSFQLDMNYKNYNQLMNIIAPEESQTFEELANTYMSSGATLPAVSAVARARDSSRLADLSTLRKAIDAASVMDSDFTLPQCTGAVTVLKCTSNNIMSPTLLRGVSGEGWLPVDVSEFIAVLPIDPKNGESIVTPSGEIVTAGYYFRSDGDMYKLATYLEDSARADMMATDGGSNPEMYETGTEMTKRFGL